MNLKKYIVIVFLLIASAQTHAQQIQKEADTTAILKDFIKALRFSNEPFLYYNANIKMQSIPILMPEDTMQLKARFYKTNDAQFASNSIEETYIQDSFEIEVNNDRHTIWISKVNAETLASAGQLPIPEKEWRNLLKNKFTISQTEATKGLNTINFETTQNYDSISSLKTNLAMVYDSKKYLPIKLEMDVASKQQISEENVQELKNQGTNIKELVKIEGDIIFMVRSQKMTMTFLQIDNTKEKAMQMPSWKSILSYDTIQDEFTIKNEKYSDYEITKTY
jgi:hypothetical protein